MILFLLQKDLSLEFVDSNVLPNAHQLRQMLRCPGWDGLFKKVLGAASGDVQLEGDVDMEREEPLNAACCLAEFTKPPRATVGAMPEYKTAEKNKCSRAPLEKKKRVHAMRTKPFSFNYFRKCENHRNARTRINNPAARRQKNALIIDTDKFQPTDSYLPARSLSSFVPLPVRQPGRPS